MSAALHVRDPDGEVRAVLVRIVERLDQAHPAGRHTVSDVARAVLLHAEDPAILHKLGLRPDGTAATAAAPLPAGMTRRGGMRR